MNSSFEALQRALAGRYSLERPLGRGGMGVVYLARDVMLERQVALKIVAPEFSTSETRERLLREARIAAQLQHPNIVPVHSVESLDDGILICMSYVDGGTLADRIRARGTMRADETARLLREIALALAYAHRRGIVHRDIKPENILLDRESGRAMVADFGIARVATQSTSGPVVGTPGYMSPEHIAGLPLDDRSDLYAVGVVGHFCMTGTIPAPGQSGRDLTAAPRLMRVLARCMQPDPNDRFANGEEMAQSLDALIEKRGELPAPLAEWIGRPNELTLSQAAAAPLLLTGLWFALDWTVNPFLFNSGPKFFDSEAGLVTGCALTPLLYLLRRAWLLRRAAANGYSIGDVQSALTSAVEHDGDDRRSALVRLAFGATLGVVLLRVASIGGPMGNSVLVFYPTIAAVGATILGLHDLLAKGKRLDRKLREGFWKGRFGRWAYAIATLGRKPSNAVSALPNRPTELALGAAAVALFEGLPKPMQKQLAGIPDAVTALEAAAERYRRQLEALDGLDLAGPKPSPDADAAVQGKLAAAAREIEHQRERAERGRRDVIAALEVLRLDLLRLHAQGDTGGVTGDVQTALSLSERLKAEANARDEVDRFLNRAADLTATPV